MTIVSILIWNLIAPTLVAAGLVGLGRRLTRLDWSARWGVALGLGLAYLVGHWGILGRPPFPGISATDWLPWLVLASIFLGTLEATRPIPTWATWVLRAVFVGGLLTLVLWSMLDNRWTATQAGLWLAGLELVILLGWWNLEAQAERIPGPGWMFHLGLVSAGWAAVQTLSGGASTGQLEGVLASAALGALPMVGIRPGSALSKGGPAVVVTILASLGLIGFFYSNVPIPSAILMILAPWTPWIDRIGLIRRRTPWTRAAVRGLAVLMTVGAAVLFAEAISRTPLEDGFSALKSAASPAPPVSPPGIIVNFVRVVSSECGLCGFFPIRISFSIETIPLRSIE